MLGNDKPTGSSSKGIASSRVTALNIRAHDKISGIYEALHTEIFNKREQERLRECLADAAGSIQGGSGIRHALDFGSGSGNLTKHLIDLGFHVLSMDVSEEFLSLIQSRFEKTGLSDVIHANGQDLSNVNSGSVDLAATYSVLHHVPDYLYIVKELARVVRSGGIVYLDHEANNGFWEQGDSYLEFRRLASPQRKKSLKRFLRLKTYVERMRAIVNPRYQPEGDIHVWPDDHIEWDRIKNVLLKSGCEILKEGEYLLFRGEYSVEVYELFKTKCSDMKYLIARKK